MMHGQKNIKSVIMCLQK